MPWKELSKMDERMRFVARLMEGEKMAVLCREFDISRKTGYKLYNRYKDSGVEGLTDRRGVSGFLCDESYTAREGQEQLWRRTQQKDFRRSYWISCWRDVTRRRYWIPVV